MSNILLPDHVAKDLTKGTVSRRQFIMSALAAGILLPAAMTMANKAMAATPKQGGKLRIGMGHGATTDTLDPATFENSMATQTGFS